MSATICSRQSGLRIATLGYLLVGISVSLGTVVHADNFRIDNSYFVNRNDPAYAAPPNTINNAAPSRRGRQRSAQSRRRSTSMAYRPSSMTSERPPSVCLRHGLDRR